MGLIKLLIISSIITFFVSFAYAQPSVQATVDSVWVCEGDSVHLEANGSTNFMMNNDFDNGSVGVGWSSNCNPQFDNPCLPSPNGSTYLWVGSTISYPRRLTTVTYQVTTDCEICFDMAYATQSQASPCEGPDLSTEGVHLQYSTNGGTTWTDINYWDPLGGYDPQMTSWNNYCEDVPVGGNVQFSWYQDVTSGNGYDHWGLDNVQIFCPYGFVYEEWVDQNNNLVDSGNTAGALPNTSQYYYVNVEDSLGGTASDSVWVTVYPTPNLSIDNLNAGYCVSASSFQLQGTPAGGDWSGPLCDAAGNFDPSLMGPGTYDVNYHIYQTYTHFVNGVDTFFVDDFSSDMGWTGYGSGGWTRGTAATSTGCSGGQDPSTDHTSTADNYLIGNYIGACYPNSMASTYWLSSPVIDCTNHTNCGISFWSFSGCESSSFDHIYVDVYDGTSWTNVYSNTTTSFYETSWTNKTYNVSAQADNNPNFQVRFGMGTTDGSVQYMGWNIDDFKVYGDINMMVTDTLCDFQTTQSVNIFNQPSPLFTFIDSICVNSSTSVQYNGNASSSATYTWDFSSGNGTVLSGTGQGPIEVEYNQSGVFDMYLQVNENGCIADTTLQITVLPAGHPNCCTLPTPDAGPNDSICGSNYSLQATASVGTASWSVISGPGTATFSPAGSANATVTVTQFGTYWFQYLEDNGSSCTAADSVQIKFAQDPIFDFTITDLLCNNVCTGEINVFPLDSSDWPHTYNWSNGSTNPTISNLCAGTYDVTVTNNIGCTSTGSPVVSEPTQVTTTVTGTNPSCYGYSDGSAVANPSGGTPPYSYLWSDSQNTQTASNLADGTYQVTVTDDYGCETIESVTINEPTQVIASATSTPVSCYGLSDGTATVDATGGSGTYTNFTWDANANNQTTQTATNLATGTYSVTIADNNGCLGETTVTVNEPTAPLMITVDGYSDVNCFNGSDGSISISVTGGTPSYLFDWDNDGTGDNDDSEDITGIQAGTYNVVVTDANGCTNSGTATISQPTQLEQTTSSIPTTCYDSMDGQASITVSGGTPSYNYLWSNGGMGSQIINVYSGTYTVTVTDANNCTITTSVYVDRPDEVVASVSADVWICMGQSTTLNASATGGTPGYTFYWNEGSQTNNIQVSPTVTTEYYVFAEDANGCTSSKRYVTVHVYPPISLELSASDYEICTGESVVLLSAPSGGNGNYTLTLTNNGNIISSAQTVFPSESTTYTVVASDDCGSPTDEQEVSIVVNPLPPVSFMPDTTEGCQPLTVHFVEISQDQGQTYSWDFGDLNSYNTSTDKNPIHIFEEEGTYTVKLTVTSSKGCKNSQVIDDLIKVYPIPEAKFLADPEVASVIKPVIFFENLTDNIVENHWMFGDGDSSLNRNPYHTYAAIAGIYLVELRVETEFGCRDTAFDEVRIRDEYTFYAPTAFSPDNDGKNDNFFVAGNGIDENVYNLIIFDRWGEIIFETKDINAQWDGTAKQGNRKCPIGTYTWLATFKDNAGIIHQESGAVTIIR